jgi:putative endonuclease
MATVYVLQSQTTQRFYIGCTERGLARLAEHQRGQTLSTRGRGPWVLVYQEEYVLLADALRRERQIKKWKSHRSIAELIQASRTTR